MKLVLWLLVALLQVAQPGPGQLSEEGWSLLPPYEGQHRWFLREEQERQVTAAAHVFRAALVLDGDHVRALEGLGHAEVLLAENQRNRGMLEQARKHYKESVSALSRVLELSPEDPWAPYALGAIQTAFGEHEQSLIHLSKALELATLRIPSTGEDGPDAIMRFKALQWIPEVCMRLGDFEDARTAMRVFHEEYSDNSWPLLIALAESYLRERDFGRARRCYQTILLEYPDDPQAYDLIGYLDGLVGDSGLAEAWLGKSLAREWLPGMYRRLWLYILSSGAPRQAAKQELSRFLSFPPESLQAWDRTLGLFVLGNGSVDGFLEEAHAEVERRKLANAPLDFLFCEVWFYIGFRHEREARRSAEGDIRRKKLNAALAAYRQSISVEPTAWNWEWAYARSHFTSVASDLQLEPAAAFTLEGGRLVSDGKAAIVERILWHRAGSLNAVPKLESALEPGDLLLASVRREPGGLAWLRWVVDAEEPQESEAPPTSVPASQPAPSAKAGD